MASSSDRVDIIPKNKGITSKVVCFGIISTLTLELAIGTSMVISENIMLVYYKVFEPSKSVGTCILMVNLSKHCVNRATVLLIGFGTKCTT